MKILDSSVGWTQQPLPLQHVKLPTLQNAGVQPPNILSSIKEPKIYIWRVTRYTVVHWPEEDYGHFYSSDAYLILNLHQQTVRTTDVHYDIYIWIGRQAVQEDYFTAVDRMTDLDSKLGRKGILHREVQSHESSQFLSCFNPITLWNGSSNQNYSALEMSGSNHSSRLLAFFKPDPHMKQIVVKEVNTSIELDNARVYILDLGKKIYHWIGSLVGSELSLLALKYSEGLKAARGLRTKVDVINEKFEDDDTATLHPFYVYLSKENNSLQRSVSEDSTSVPVFPSMMRPKRKGVAKLFRIRGNDYQKMKEGHITYKDLEKHKYCIFENGRECYVWVARSGTAYEFEFALAHAHNYLIATKSPCLPVTVLRETQTSPSFQRALVA